jgi:hypothetical protein
MLPREYLTNPRKPKEYTQPIRIAYNGYEEGLPDRIKKQNRDDYSELYNSFQKKKTYEDKHGYDLRTTIKSIERATDNVYLNVVIDHSDLHGHTGGTGPNFPTQYVTNGDDEEAVYNVTKNEIILDKCSDFYCSVARFTIPLNAVPLAICPIIPNQSDPNLTPMIIGIEYPLSIITDRFPKNLEYDPQNFYQAPSQIGSQNQLVTDYYYIYSYQQIINMFNEALDLAWIASGLSVLFPNYIPPYFFFTASTNLLTLVVPTCFVRTTSPATAIPKIFINNVSTNYLGGFNYFFNADNTIQGNDYYFLFNDTPDQYYYPNGVAIPGGIAPTVGLPALPYYYSYTQEYSFLEYWTSLRRIIVSSNSIPVRNEYLPSGNNLNNNIGNNANGANSSFPILTDFIPNIEMSSGDSRSIAYYIPSPQYRLIDLLSEGPLQTIDIKLYWEDKEGNFFPIFISPLQQASLKLGFFRKSLYKEDELTGRLMTKIIEEGKSEKK